MHRLIALLAFACLLWPRMGESQDARLKLPDFKSLASTAIDSVDISLDPWLLRTVGAFIDDKDPDAAATKSLLAGIRSIQIRNFSFATDFAYPKDDIDAVRRQLTAPGWSQLMQVRNRDTSNNVDIYVLTENNQTQGFALIASEPRQFTIINIVGSIRLEDLPKLQDQLHLPKMKTTAI